MSAHRKPPVTASSHVYLSRELSRRLRGYLNNTASDVIEAETGVTKRTIRKYLKCAIDHPSRDPLGSTVAQIDRICRVLGMEIETALCRGSLVMREPVHTFLGSREGLDGRSASAAVMDLRAMIELSQWMHADLGLELDKTRLHVAAQGDTDSLALVWQRLDHGTRIVLGSPVVNPWFHDAFLRVRGEMEEQLNHFRLQLHESIRDKVGHDSYLHLKDLGYIDFVPKQGEVGVSLGEDLFFPRDINPESGGAQTPGEHSPERHRDVAVVMIEAVQIETPTVILAGQGATGTLAAVRLATAIWDTLTTILASCTAVAVICPVSGFVNKETLPVEIEFAPADKRKEIKGRSRAESAARFRR